jgi:hypothetical protein
MDLVWDCLELLGVWCESYWLFNHFLNEKKNQIWQLYWNLEVFLVFRKALDESDLIRFISQFWELRCGRYWFLGAFWRWKFKQITKIGIGRKNQLSPQCAHTWANITFYSSNNNLPDNFLVSWKLIRELTRLVTWEVASRELTRETTLNDNNYFTKNETCWGRGNSGIFFWNKCSLLVI